MPRQIWSLTISTILLSVLFAFNNCGQDVKFGEVPQAPKENSQQGLPDTDHFPVEDGSEELTPEPAKDLDEAKEDIANACETGTVEEVVHEVFIPDPQTTCAWNQDGNLNARNQYLQARLEQSFDFTLPENSKICGLDFQFEEQEFLYDDHFLFTFNDAILASSYDFSDRLEAAQGVLLYDWENIAGRYWDKERQGIFCAATSDMTSPSLCSWPDTDTKGTIHMVYPEDLIHTVMALTPDQRTHSFRMVTIGDNDGRDCEHSDVQFQFKIKYVRQ